MRLEIDIAEHHYNNIMALDSVSLGRVPYKGIIMYSINAIKHGKVLEQESNSSENPTSSTTKNDLGVDCISRADAIQVMQDKAKKLTNEDTINGLCGAVAILFDLPSVTPQLSVPEDTALAEWTEKLTKECEDAYNKGYADGMKAQEPRWIPISEKLPEDFETVIASVDRGYVYPEARYSKEKGWEWAYESGAEFWVEIESDVLAWMPLPSAYKRGEEE